MSSEARGVGRIFRPKYPPVGLSYKEAKAAGLLRQVKTWWISFACRKMCGQADCRGRHSESTESTSRREAEKLLRKRMGEIGLGKLTTPDIEKTTFADLVKLIENDYAANRRKSGERLKYSLVHLREAFGTSRAIAITTARVKEYIAERLKAKAAPWTIRCELASLKRMFALAMQAGMLAQVPYIPPLQVSNARQGFFEQRQLDAVLTHLPEDLRPPMRRGLARLQDAEFLYEAQLFPDLEFTFKHALTHDVAYAGLLGERRHELHAAVVTAIERLHGGRLAEHVERLAHHAVRAELWEQALDYLSQAGSRAAERLAFPEAADYLEQAVAAVPRHPRRREALEQSIDLRMALRLALFRLGEFDRVRDHLSAAAVIASEIGDQVRLAQVTALQAHYHCIMRGEMREALDCARRATAIAEGTGTPAIIGLARHNLGQVQHGLGDYRDTIATLRANVEVFQAELADERGGYSGPLSLFSRVVCLCPC